ncbi:DUF2268 domain-containing putative Zn-dependent protease [Pluralibacter gergoviae]|uniref:DUF2268 domain-containing putative Zn-dependent protease n=1 Tax=Pluralibacter gergoviae TaxID=61647 RepID=UPI003EE0D0E4
MTESVTIFCQLMSLAFQDVVVKAGAFVIPEKGHLGFCPESGLITITVDPQSPAFCQNDAQSLERMFAHELHHAARRAAVGYGATLGEVIVSEGLAGHFALEVFAGEPEPWERLSAEDVTPWLPSLSELWDSRDYDHNAWFFGTGSLPRWLGYSAGFQLLSRYFAANPHQRASLLAGEGAEAFREFVFVR